MSSNNTYLKGSIDDIRLYNFTLSPEEVFNIASWNLPVNHPPVMVAKATSSANPVILPEGCNLKVEVVDPDGDELTFEWWKRFRAG